MPIMSLSGSERDFLTLLGEVVFGNPFSAKRAEVVTRLAPDVPLGDVTAHREALAHAVASRFARILEEPRILQRLGEETRHLLEPALLYVCYHRYLPQLDALIAQQANGGAPSPVSFAGEAIGTLVQGGIDEQRAVQFFAGFFQLRRAFYFILGSLAGECESMRRLREALWNNVFTHDMRSYMDGLWNRMEDFSTLLLGETGTGKGQAAAAIGRSAYIPYLPGERCFAANFAETFISINLSQYPETLIESALFGHRKGAFTGASDHHRGVFERCSTNGALFLDELGEVSIPVQVKLLQVLQERTFTPLGGSEKKRFSGRVIAATNRNLADLQAEGRFREDFFYRLCSDVIEVPSLRQRVSESPRELELLVAQLVERIAGTRNTDGVLTALARDLPAGYSWPGNVRELEQAVRRVLLTGRYLPPPAQARNDDDILVARLRGGELSAAELVAGYSRMLYRRLGTYADVAKRTGLDPRTSRKHIEGEGSG